MRHRHLNHRAYWSKTAADVLRRLIYVSSIRTIYSTNVHAWLLNCTRESLHYIQVWVELDLAWTIEEHEAFIWKLLELLQEPIYVIDKVLHAVYETSVRTPIFYFLDIIKWDQIPNIDVALVLENFCSRVQVTNLNSATLLLRDFLNRVAKSRLSRPSRSDHHTTKSTCHLINYYCQ